MELNGSKMLQDNASAANDTPKSDSTKTVKANRIVEDLNNFKAEKKAANPFKSDLLKIASPKRFDNNQSLQEVMAGTKTLSQGSKGDDIKLIQEALNDMGFYAGDKADGAFGKQTATALKNFQDSRKIPVTGVIDQKTMTELNKVAPPENKKIWDKGINFDFAEEPAFPSNLLEDGKRAKIVIDLSQHRLFLFDDNNEVQKTYSIATGNKNHPDGKGAATATGIKVVNYKYDDPSPVAKKLWPESGGRAFGTKMLDLSWFDLKTGKTKGHGEELHGTFDRKSIGTDASHGCMRMQNEDIEEVYRLVKKGDIVKIQE